jgi:hypothetical protein
VLGHPRHLLKLRRVVRRHHHPHASEGVARLAIRGIDHHLVETSKSEGQENGGVCGHAGFGSGF